MIVNDTILGFSGIFILLTLTLSWVLLIVLCAEVDFEYDNDTIVLQVLVETDVTILHLLYINVDSRHNSGLFELDKPLWYVALHLHVLRCTEMSFTEEDIW